jgi:Icc protein
MTNSPIDVFNNLPEGSIKLLQITDTHLFRETDGQLMGVNTASTLDEVLQLAFQQKELDCVLATGDLVHDGSASGYRRFVSLMQGFEKPVYCLPGNHDDSRKMAEIINAENVNMTFSVQLANWQIIMLDSSVPDSASGELDSSQLAKLERQLEKHPYRHTLVCLHHNPVPVNSQWLDKMTLQNAGDFFDIIDSHPNVRGILWGHVHQEFDQLRKRVRLLGSPSTCIQFARQSKSFGLDQDPPGCRWLALLPDGSIRTSVSRLKTVPAGLQQHGKGYS